MIEEMKEGEGSSKRGNIESESSRDDNDRDRKRYKSVDDENDEPCIEIMPQACFVILVLAIIIYAAADHERVISLFE
jgi:hypothetical protein